LSALLAQPKLTFPIIVKCSQKLGPPHRSRDIRNLNDFSSLPMLTKDVIPNAPAILLRDDARKDELRMSHSGGSTGVPLSFYHDRSYDETSEAGTFRKSAPMRMEARTTIAYVWGPAMTACMQYRAGNWSCVSVCSAAISSIRSILAPPRWMPGLEKWKRIRPAVPLGTHLQSRVLLNMDILRYRT